MSMLNSFEFYREIGRQAAEARNQHDEARAKFHAEYFRKARALEKEEFRILAGQIYDDAYKEFRNVPRVEYFK